MAQIQSQDHVVLESDGAVDLGFVRNRGDLSIRSRAFAYTRDVSTTAGEYE